MTTYLFCIGGTGARVLRSLTMLLASGVRIEKGDSIVPIIIDYDLQNGDLEQTKMLVGRYKNLNEIAKYEKNEEGFFYTPIAIRPYSIVDIKNDSGSETFKKYLDFQTLKNVSKETAELMEALYDNSPQDDPRTELNLEMSKGFKGNPNIGSVVFNEYFRNKAYGYDQFLSNFAKGDRVFIVGSIFGGTGSSGLPSLVKKFRQSGTTSDVGNNTFLKDAPIGTCVVLPYFDVAQKDTSAINSLTFNSKAKAALTYYQAELYDKLNEIYYIGCLKKKEAYPNFEGGKEQRNNAHVIELLSAMSVIEFAKRDGREMENYDDSGKPIPNCYEFTTTTGLVEKDGVAQIADPSYLDLLAIPSDQETGVYAKYERFLNMFAFFTKYCQDYTFRGNHPGWGKPQYYKKLEPFINKETDFGGLLYSFQDAFMQWANELATNSLFQFDPYDFEHNLSMLIHIHDASSRIKKPEETITHSLDLSYKEMGGDTYNNKEGQFLRIGFMASDQAVLKLE